MQNHRMHGLRSIHGNDKFGLSFRRDCTLLTQIAIPSCRFWNGSIPAAAWWLHQQFPNVPWDFLELTALLMNAALPLLAIGLLGAAVAKCIRFLHRRSAARPVVPPTDAPVWRFSLRKMMVMVAVFGLVLGWNMQWIRREQDARQEKQQAFVKRFKASFTCGQVELLAEPTMEGLHRSATSESGYRVFHSPGISEYRITAPIREAGSDKWAELAELGHATRARITQILNLLGLAPDIQEALLFMQPTERGPDRIKERDLRPVATLADWEKQRRLFALVLRVGQRSENSSANGRA